MRQRLDQRGSILNDSFIFIISRIKHTTSRSTECACFEVTTRATNQYYFIIIINVGMLQTQNSI